MRQDPPPKRKPPRTHNAEFQIWKRAKTEGDFRNARPHEAEFQAWKAERDAPESAHDKTLGLLRHAYQGLSVGLGDKLTAVTRIALPEMLGGTKKGTTLEEAIREERGHLERSRARHPYVAAGADAVGSLPPLIASAGLSALAKVPTLLRSLKAGAGFGALRSAGESVGETNTKDFLANTAAGAGVGAAAGGLVHGAVKTPGAVMDWTGLRPTRTPTSRVGRAARAMGVEPREDRALEAVIRKVEQSRMTPADVTAAAAEARELGKPMMLADVVGKPVQRLMRGAQGIPSRGADEIQFALEHRRGGAATRIASDVEEGLGRPRQDTFTAQQTLAVEQKAKARPLYAAAEGEALAFEDIPRPQTKAVRKKLADAANLPYVAQHVERIQARSQFGGMRPTDHLVLDQAYKDIGHDIRLLRKMDERGNLGPEQNRQLQDLLEQRRALHAALVARAPKYADALKSWGGDAELAEALDFGRGFLTGGRSAPQLAHELSEFSAAGRDHARIGVVDAVRAEIDKAPDGADVARRIFANAMQRERLRVAFQNERAFQRFERQMKMEATMAKTDALPGGSQTAEKFADQADVAEPLASPGNLFTMRGAANALLRTGDRERMGFLAKQKVDALAPYLTAGSGAPETRTLENVLEEMARLRSSRILGARRANVGRALAAGAAARQVARP